MLLILLIFFPINCAVVLAPHGSTGLTFTCVWKLGYVFWCGGNCPITPIGKKTDFLTSLRYRNQFRDQLRLDSKVSTFVKKKAYHLISTKRVHFPIHQNTSVSERVENLNPVFPWEVTCEVFAQHEEENWCMIYNYIYFYIWVYISTNGSSYRRFLPTTDCRSTVRIFTGKIRDAAEHFRFHDSY